MVQCTAMVLSVAVLCSVALLCQASPVDWWKSEFAREEEKEILEDVAARIISELESAMMIQQNGGKTCTETEAKNVREEFYDTSNADLHQNPADFSVTIECNPEYSLFLTPKGVALADARQRDFVRAPNEANSSKYDCPYNDSIYEQGYPKCFRECPELHVDPIAYRDVKYEFRYRIAGDRATYSCKNDNFELKNGSIRICTANSTHAEWTSTVPKCIPLCPQLPATIGNGRLNNPTNRRSRPGAEATYSCNTGPGEYELEGSPRTCTEVAGEGRAIWLPGDEPKCIPLCPMLEDKILNGYLDNPTNRRPGAIATYSCNNGPGEYVLDGPKTRRCIIDGEGKKATWSGDKPKCIPLCPKLPDTIGNVNVNRPTNRRPGAIATYSCKDVPGEHVLDGPETKTCTKDADGKRATWLPSGDPKCIPLCPMLEDKIVNGYLDNPTNRRPGAEATYSCNTGPGEYVLEGSPRTCTEVAGGSRAIWLPGDEPKCIPLCPELPNTIGNVIVNRPTNRRPGAIATYSCRKDVPGEHVFDGPETKTCTKDADGKRATWQPSDDPKCIPLCPELLPIPFGSVTFHDRKPGDIARYGCIGDQFQIEGNDIRICGEEGEWLGPVPTCVPLICPPVGLNIPNGESNTSRGPVEGPGGSRGYGVGTVITYACGEDYELRGERERTCILPEGGEPEWDHEPPRCDIPLCPVLPAPPNGAVNYGNREPGDVANYTCRYGYQLVGSEMRICVRDQDGIPKWSGKPPVCKIIICPSDSLPITNGEFSPSSGGRRGFVVGTVVHYTCTSDRFELRGESRRTCLESGEWDHPRPSCVAVRCPELKLIANPKSVDETRRQIERDRPRNYLELLSEHFFEKNIKGNPVPYDEGSKAYLTCTHGWELMPKSPSVQTCVRDNENDDLVWTEPGTCVYSYSITKPALTGFTG